MQLGDRMNAMDIRTTQSPHRTGKGHSIGTDFTVYLRLIPSFRRLRVVFAYNMIFLSPRGLYLGDRMGYLSLANGMLSLTISSQLQQCTLVAHTLLPGTC